MLKKFVIFLLLCAGHSILAQETARVVNEDFSQGIVIELAGNALSLSANFVAVSDSSNHEFVLTNLALDNQNVWIKNSDEVAEIENTAHWHYNNETDILFLDLRGIRSALTAGSVLQFTIVPLNTIENDLSLSVFETSLDSGNLPDESQKINDLQLNLK